MVKMIITVSPNKVWISFFVPGSCTVHLPHQLCSFTVTTQLIAQSHFSKNRTPLWLHSHCVCLLGIVCHQNPIATNWLPGVWICNILNLWVINFHYKGNLSPNTCSQTQTDCKHIRLWLDSECEQVHFCLTWLSVYVDGNRFATDWRFAIFADLSKWVATNRFHIIISFHPFQEVTRSPVHFLYLQ